MSYFPQVAEADFLDKLDKLFDAFSQHKLKVEKLKDLKRKTDRI